MNAAKLLGRVVIAALLLLAVATPSLAELGFLETTTHAAVAADDGSIPFAADNHDGEDEKKSPAGPAKHCAFSHCAHTLPVEPPLTSAEHVQISSDIYASRAESPPLDAAAARHEHPPKA